VTFSALKSSCHLLLPVQPLKYKGNMLLFGARFGKGRENNRCIGAKLRVLWDLLTNDVEAGDAAASLSNFF